MNDSLEPPAGPRKHAWFAGMLDGRRGDYARTEQTVAGLNALGLVKAEVFREGGRFQVLVEEGVLTAERFEAADLDAFVTALGDVVASSARPEEVESTVRCVEVYEEGVVETLFAVRGGEIRPVSQVRELEADDLAASPFTPVSPEARKAGLRAAAMICVLCLLGFGAVAWQSGWVDRVLGAEAGTLDVEPGQFEGLLVVAVESHWGDYRLTVRRVADYPASPAEVALLKEAAPSLTHAAALGAVAGGDSVFSGRGPSRRYGFAPVRLLPR